MKNVTIHKNGKHQPKKLVCNQCNFETFWTNELLHHKRTVHDIFKNYCKSRETLRLSDVVRLCDHYGFQTNKYSTMIQHKQKKCGSSKLSKPFVKIDVEITAESDAAKVLSEVEKYQADMSWKDATPKPVRCGSFGITVNYTMSEPTSEIEKPSIPILTIEGSVKPLEVEWSMTNTLQEEKVKLVNLSDCEDANTVKQIVDESVLITPPPSLNNLIIEDDPQTQGITSEDLNENVASENYDY